MKVLTLFVAGCAYMYVCVWNGFKFYNISRHNFTKCHLWILACLARPFCCSLAASALCLRVNHPIQPQSQQKQLSGTRHWEFVIVVLRSVHQEEMRQLDDNDVSILIRCSYFHIFYLHNFMKYFIRNAVIWFTSLIIHFPCSSSSACSHPIQMPWNKRSLRRTTYPKTISSNAVPLPQILIQFYGFIIRFAECKKRWDLEGSSRQIWNMKMSCSLTLPLSYLSHFSLFSHPCVLLCKWVYLLMSTNEFDREEKALIKSSTILIIILASHKPIYIRCGSWV